MIYFLRADRSFFILLGALLAVVVGVVLHDTVVSLVARALGDPLPARRGLPTVRPRLSPYAIVAAVFAIWTWTNPVPVATYPAKWKPRATLSLASGILTYLALAGLASTGLKSLDLGLSANLALFVLGAYQGFILLAGCSLLPIPPADLGRIVFVFAPARGRWVRVRELLVDGEVGVYVLLAIAIVPVLLQGLPSLVTNLTAPLADDLLGLVGLKVGIL